MAPQGTGNVDANVSGQAGSFGVVRILSSAVTRVRQWLSTQVVPEGSESSQRIAGEAAAAAATDAAGAAGAAGTGAAGAAEAETTTAPPAPRPTTTGAGTPELPEVTADQLASGKESVHGAQRAAGGTYTLNAPDPLIPQDTGAAAFFDVDNTLIKGASLLLFARGLARRRFFTVEQIVSFIWQQLKFSVSGKENAKDIAAGREKALSLVAGHREAEVKQLAADIWEKTLSDRIYPGVRELADMHLAAGQQVWLVTATPVQLAQVIAKRLGFTGALGTVAEVSDDADPIFTGRMEGDILHGPGKRFAVAALARELNLDLTRCTAYSDSYNDLPLLSMVGTAVAVNADFKLRRAARDFGWDAREYRRRGQKRFLFGTPALLAALLASAFTACSLRRVQR